MPVPHVLCDGRGEAMSGPWYDGWSPTPFEKLLLVTMTMGERPGVLNVSSVLGRMNLWRAVVAISIGTQDRSVLYV